MNETRLPNFFIVGAPKAGTTSLYHHLRQHPDIYMSPLKETSYFSNEFRVENLVSDLEGIGRQSQAELRRYLDTHPLGDRFGGMVTEWRDYLSLFEQAGMESAIGEASPGYLWSRTAALRIAQVAPHARIIMILRNPVERAFSQYMQMSNTGPYRLTFEEHIAACLAERSTDRISMVYPFLEYGLYSEQLDRYLATFPRSQLGIWLYEETLLPGFLQQVFEFLGVNAEFMPDTSKRYLEQHIPRITYLSRLAAHPAVASTLQMLVPETIRPMLKRIEFHELLKHRDGAQLIVSVILLEPDPNFPGKGIEEIETL